MNPSNQHIFANACRDFEQYLLSHRPKVAGFHPYFESAFWEMLENGGKRFRPSLLLAIVSAKCRELIYNAFDVCLAIECLHTYSLVHDDLPSMDNADMRRGHVTLHCKYEESTAVLVGDGLNTYSFYLLSCAKFSPQTKVELIETLSYNGGLHGMVIGQALDCKFENIPLSQDKLDFIHIHKTARLIAASLKMGAIIANMSAAEIQNLYDFGLNLGLYFQIRDDIIDFVQDESKSLKTSLNDIHKNSYVNLLGIDEARKIAREHVEILKGMLEDFKDLGLYENLNSLLQSYFNPL